MSKKPVAGYNPRFVTWWIEGARTPTTVEFPTRRIATRFRQDLYELRFAMRNESHYATTFANKAEIIRRPVNPLHAGPDDPHTLTIRPANFDANQYLDVAGLAEPVAPSDTTTLLTQREDTDTEDSSPLNYGDLMRPKRPDK